MCARDRFSGCKSLVDTPARNRDVVGSIPTTQTGPRRWAGAPRLSFSIEEPRRDASPRLRRTFGPAIAGEVLWRHAGAPCRCRGFDSRRPHRSDSCPRRELEQHRVSETRHCGFDSHRGYQRGWSLCLRLYGPRDPGLLRAAETKTKDCPPTDRDSDVAAASQTSNLVARVRIPRVAPSKRRCSSAGASSRLVSGRQEFDSPLRLPINLSLSATAGREERQ